MPDKTLIEVHEIRDDPQLAVSDAVSADVRHEIKKLTPTEFRPGEGQAPYPPLRPRHPLRPRPPGGGQDRPRGRLRARLPAATGGAHGRLHGPPEEDHGGAREDRALRRWPRRRPRSPPPPAAKPRSRSCRRARSTTCSGRPCPVSR